MSKTTISILTSILLSTAMAAPVHAGTQSRYPFLARLLGASEQHVANGQHATRTNTSVQRHMASPPVNADLTVYDVPGATRTSGVGINQAGAVAGEFDDSDGNTHGFLRAPEGKSYTIIDVGTHPTGGFWLNDKNAVIGDYFAGGIVRAYVRQPSGKIAKIDLPDSQHADGVDINDQGVATGDYVDSNGLWRGFIRMRDGTLTTFGDPKAATGAGQGTFAGATNVLGETIGPYVDENNILHGYIRHSDNSFTEFDVAGAVDTIPFNENARGWVVGFCDDANGVLHGFIRRPDGRMIAVDAPDAGTDPGLGTMVQDINERGVATGNYFDANGVPHGFVFTVKSRTLAEFDAPGVGPGGTNPVSINNAGQVSGTVVDENDVSHGFTGVP